MKVRKYYVEFAATCGKTCFVGGGPKGYPTMRVAARLFDTVEEAQDAADMIDERYLIKGALPVIRDKVVHAVPDEVLLPGLRLHQERVRRYG